MGQSAFAQSHLLQYKGHRNYSFVERSDLRVYLNGRYIGLQNKQVGAFIIPSQNDKGLIYEGNFYVNQDTTRNQMAVAEGLHQAIPSAFVIDSEGKLTMLNDNGYPSFRSFPAYSSHKIQKGDVWQAQATRAVDPLSKGVVTKMPIYVQYTYTGDDVFNGEPVYLITAQWATRYGMYSTTHYIDWGGDKELEKAQGSHKATLIVSKATGAALVIRDNVDETFTYTDGNSYQFKGTISLFTEYPPAVDRSKIVDAIKRIVQLDDEEADALLGSVAMADGSEGLSAEGLADGAAGTGTGAGSGAQGKELAKGEAFNPDQLDNQLVKEDYTDKWEKLSADYDDSKELAANTPAKPKKSDTKKTLSDKKSDITDKVAKENAASPEKKISVENTDAGIRLTMQNIQFKADSAELLPGEEERLNQIAEILKVAEGANFLIEGHTASTGYEAGEMKLSLERAEAVARALKARGISSERFICKGSGGKKPIAPNTTAEGKAKNRRVEITILD